MFGRCWEVAAIVLAAALSAGCESLAGLDAFVDGSSSGGKGGTGSGAMGGGAMGGGAMGGDGAGGGCRPDCDGNHCRDDGCGTPCACAEGGICSDGAICCEPTAGPWAVAYDGEIVQDMTVLGSTLFTLTTELAVDCKTRVRAHATCDGTLLAERADFEDCSRGRGLLAAGTTVFVSGARMDIEDVERAWVGRLDAVDLSDIAMDQTAAPPPVLGPMAINAGGLLFFGGGRGPGEGYFAVGGTSGPCQVGPTLGYPATRPLFHQTWAIVASTNTGGMVSLKRFSTCGPAPCGCSAMNETAEFAPDVDGFKSTMTLVAHGSTGLVIGGGSNEAFIAEVDLTSGAYQGTHVHASASGASRWTSAAVHDDQLLVVGLENHDGSSGTAVLHVYDLPLAGTPVPAWEATLDGALAFSRVQVAKLPADRGERIFVAGPTGVGNEFVSTCTPAGCQAPPPP